MKILMIGFDIKFDASPEAKERESISSKRTGFMEPLVSQQIRRILSPFFSRALFDTARACGS
jgi:hypothetical protein